MIIDSYAIQLSSSHQKQTSIVQRESVSRQRAADPDIEGLRDEVSDNSNKPDNANNVSVEISRASLAIRQRLEELQKQIEDGNQGFSEAIESIFAGDDDSTEAQLDAKTYQLKSIVESFIGREIELQTVIDTETELTSESSVAADTAPLPTRRDLVTVIELSEQRREFEQTSFSAQGRLQTVDGQTIDIDLSQILQREFISETQIQVIATEGELKDPLVINLPNSGLELTQNRVSFDIDADGELDEVNFATGNSGFLSLDLNNNGRVDDGSELFGAISGNGFADLAQYDDDGNNFIDAGDSVFSRLQILRKNEDGQDLLTDLQSAGVGALFLGNTATPFEVRDSNNQLEAVVRSSGLYITANGQTGTLQQVDLVV